MNITIGTNVNDPPVNHLPAPIFATTTPIVLSNANGNKLSVTDSDAGNAANFGVTLTAANGTLALANAAGITAAGTGTAASPLLLTGTLAAINTVLAAGLVFTPTAGFTGATSITIVSNDNGNTGSGGAMTDTDTLQITVQQLNQPPVNSLPANFTTSQTTIVLSLANGNAISVADPDAGNATNFRVTLTVTKGTLSLVNGSGVSVTGNGSEFSPLVLGGTLASINTALAAGLGFTPPAGFGGATSLTMVSNDKGNTGSGGAKTDTDTLHITLEPATSSKRSTPPAAVR